MEFYNPCRGSHSAGQALGPRQHPRAPSWSREQLGRERRPLVVYTPLSWGTVSLSVVGYSDIYRCSPSRSTDSAKISNCLWQLSARSLFTLIRCPRLGAQDPIQRLRLLVVSDCALRTAGTCYTGHVGRGGSETLELQLSAFIANIQFTCKTDALRNLVDISNEHHLPLIEIPSRSPCAICRSTYSLYCIHVSHTTKE